MVFFDLHHHHSSKKSGIYNLNFGETIPENYFSVGIHPAASANVSVEIWQWVENSVQHKNCVAIGECGLDGLVDVSEVEQQSTFCRQIDLANQVQKPIIIHCVRRFPQIIRLSKKSQVPLIVHGFNKNYAVGEELKKHNFYLSFGKSILQNVNLQHLIRDFPIEKLFLETDAQTFDIIELYQRVATLKKISVTQLKNQIKENLQIFNISEFK